MKVELAPRYRFLMLALAPTTFGLGTGFLWLRSSHWPLDVDEQGLTLRNRHRWDWRSIRKIGVSCSCLDGHFSRIRIHHDGGRVITIPTNGLRDGQKVAKTVLASFKRTRRAKGREELQETYNSEPHVESEKSSAAGALLHANLVLHESGSRQAIPGPRRVIAGWSKHMGFFYRREQTQTTAGPATSSARLTDTWPLMVVTVGVALTVVWMSGVAWLSMRLLLSVV